MFLQAAVVLPTALAAGLSALGGERNALASLGSSGHWLSLLQFSLFVALPLLFLLIARGRGRLAKETGISGGSRRSSLVAFVLIAFIAFEAFVFLYEALSPDAHAASGKVVASLGFGESWLRDLIVFLTITVAAPLGEEFICRGFLFRGIYDVLLSLFVRRVRASSATRVASLVIASAASSFLFTSLHGGDGQDDQLVLIFLLGVLASVLYAITGSLFAPVLFHSLNNCFSLLLSAGEITTALGGVGFFLVVAISPLLCVGLLVFLRRAVGRSTPSSRLGVTS